METVKNTVKKPKFIKYLAIFLVIMLIGVPIFYFFAAPNIQCGERNLQNEIDSWFSAEYAMVSAPQFQGMQFFATLWEYLSTKLYNVLMSITGGEPLPEPNNTQYIQLTIVLSCENRVELDGYSAGWQTGNWFSTTWYNPYLYWNQTAIDPGEEDILFAFAIVDELPVNSTELITGVYEYQRDDAVFVNATNDNFFQWCPIEITIKVQEVADVNINFVVFKDRFPCSLGTHTYYYYVQFDNSTFTPDLYQIYLRGDGWVHIESDCRVDCKKHSMFSGWSYWAYYDATILKTIYPDVGGIYHLGEQSKGTIYERLMVMA